MSKVGKAGIWKHEHMFFLFSLLFCGGTTSGTSLSVVHLGKGLGANGLQCKIYNVQCARCKVQLFPMMCIWNNDLENCTCSCCAVLCNLQYCANVLQYVAKCNLQYAMFRNIVHNANCNVVHLGQGLGAMWFPLMFISSNFSHSLQARSLKTKQTFHVSSAFFHLLPLEHLHLKNLFGVA